MKFWQLLDIFRDEEPLLIKVFSEEKWHTYLINYHDMKDILINQKRSILDGEVENDLLIELCSQTKKVIYFSSKKKKIFSYESGFAEGKIPLLEAISLFKHDLIEEVFEKSEADIS